jgi:hypothetical protein
MRERANSRVMSAEVGREGPVWMAIAAVQD